MYKTQKTEAATEPTYTDNPHLIPVHKDASHNINTAITAYRKKGITYKLKLIT
jgi:hypothetical protein